MIAPVTPPRIVCCGAAAIDRLYRADAPLVPGSSVPGRARRGFGGVARNVAESLARLGVPAALVSAAGDDADGAAILDALATLGVDVQAVARIAGSVSAQYAAVMRPDGELAVAVADMGILDHLDPGRFGPLWPMLDAADWVFAECNLPAETIAALAARSRGTAGFRLAVDAVSVPKALRLPRDLSGIDLLFLNAAEAAAYVAERTGSAPEDPAQAARALGAAGVRGVVLTLGAEGLLVAQGGAVRRIAAGPARPVDVTGAGDALIAVVLWRMLAGAPLVAAARSGAIMAAMTTEIEASVHPDLSPRLVASAEARCRRERRAGAMR
jgi:pseudouridine kinase